MRSLQFSLQFDDFRMERIEAVRSTLFQRILFLCYFGFPYPMFGQTFYEQVQCLWIACGDSKWSDCIGEVFIARV